jgi:hypothetical protein
MPSSTWENQDLIRINECLRQAGRSGAGEIGPPALFGFVLRCAIRIGPRMISARQRFPY